MAEGLAETRSAAAGRGGTLVVQPLPGIGDAIWHLPHLRAIARATAAGRISLLTKPRSLADRLFQAEACIERVFWLRRDGGPHDGLAGIARLAALIRPYRFEVVWVLHQSARYALVAWLAGIPVRHGFGIGAQRWFLNQSGVLPAALAGAHPIEKATGLLELKGLKVGGGIADLAVAPQSRQRVLDRYGDLPQPWIAFGLGSSEPFKQWGEARFAELALRLGEAEACTIFLVGGSAEADMAQRIAETVRGRGGRVERAVGHPIDEIAALLALSRLYVGNDTGAMNLAAAVGTDAIGLFGASEPLVYSPRLHPLTPASGGGMTGISVGQVTAALGRFGFA